MQHIFYKVIKSKKTLHILHCAKIPPNCSNFTFNLQINVQTTQIQYIFNICSMSYFL